MESLMEIFLRKNGYTNVVYIDGRGWCGLMRFLYTTGLCYGMNEYGLEGRYCFESYSGALVALDNWNGVGDPDGDWIVHKGKDGEWGNSNK